jgi:hypothetical protein
MAQYDTTQNQNGTPAQQPQSQQPQVNSYGEPILQAPPMVQPGSLNDLSDFDNDHLTQQLLSMDDATNTIYDGTVGASGQYRQPEQPGQPPAQQPAPPYPQQQPQYPGYQPPYPQQPQNFQPVQQPAQPAQFPGQQYAPSQYPQPQAPPPQQPQQPSSYPEYRFMPPSPEQQQQIAQMYAQGTPPQQMPQYTPQQQYQPQMQQQQLPIPQQPQNPQQLTPQQIAELQEVQRVAQTEDWKLAMGLVKQYQTDPTGFVRTFMKDEVDQILAEQRLSGAEDPASYAEEYAEGKLTKEFGPDFEYDPAEARERGSQSYNYDRRRQALLFEGMTQYQQTQTQKEAQRAQEQAANHQAMVNRLAQAGVDPTRADQFKQLLEQLPYTPDTYWDMVVQYAERNGLLNGLRNAQPHNPQASYIPPQQVPQQQYPPMQPPYQQYQPPQNLPREVQPVPMPGVSQIPGDNTQYLQNRTRSLVDEFPRGFLTEEEY